MATDRAAHRRAPPFLDPPGYARHLPEETLLYRLVEQHYPAFAAAREAAGRPLPKYVQEEFEAYLKCGLLEHGFLRVKCEVCHAEKLVAFSCKGRGFCPSCGARRMAETAALLVDEVLPQKPLRQWVLSLPFALRFLLATHPDVLTHVLGIVYRAISGHILKKAGLSRSTGDTGAVTLIQRFGSALNLNIHFHMLFLDGAYLTGTHPLVFRRIAAPSAEELQTLLTRIAERIGRALERKGLLVRDCENSYLQLDPAAGNPLNDLIGHSITYRVAMGPRAGQKVFTLQSLPPQTEEPSRNDAAQTAGFSLHAGIGADAQQRDKLERLARYVSRPPLSAERLALTPDGNVLYTLKTPYRNGTTHIVLEPLDFLARLAALVPPPRIHLTRYHGLFAPASALRAAVTPARRGPGAGTVPDKDEGAKTPSDKHVSMTWAQ
ncbi:MAG TPA: transposase, partial [Gammaproteobacteria bacterium]|nr:transposase [Gammaproteobacteria bacterium]